MFVENILDSKSYRNFDWLIGGLVIGYCYELREYAGITGIFDKYAENHSNCVFVHLIVYMPDDNQEVRDKSDLPGPFNNIETVRLDIGLLNNSRFVSGVL